MHFESSTHIQNIIVQQKYNIYLKISSLHSKRSAYTTTQIQNNIVQQKYNILRVCKVSITNYIVLEPPSGVSG